MFEALDFNEDDNSEVLQDINYLLLDAKDEEFNFDIKLTTSYNRSYSDNIDYHILQIMFYKPKKVVKFSSNFNSNELKEIDERLINYFGNHLTGTYYNDLVQENGLPVFRLSPNPTGSPGHKFLRTSRPKGL